MQFPIDFDLHPPPLPRSFPTRIFARIGHPAMRSGRRAGITPAHTPRSPLHLAISRRTSLNLAFVPTDFLHRLVGIEQRVLQVENLVLSGTQNLLDASSNRPDSNGATAIKAGLPSFMPVYLRKTGLSAKTVPIKRRRRCLAPTPPSSHFAFGVSRLRANLSGTRLPCADPAWFRTYPIRHDRGRGALSPDATAV